MPCRGGASAMVLEGSSRAPAPASSTPDSTQPLSSARYRPPHELPTRDDIGATAVPLRERRSCVLASASDTHIVPPPRPDPRSRESAACRTPWETTFRLPVRPKMRHCTRRAPGFRLHHDGGLVMIVAQMPGNSRFPRIRPRVTICVHLVPSSTPNARRLAQAGYGKCARSEVQNMR
jgi:hypothetical protein